MDQSIKLEIVTPERVVLQEEIEALVAPASEGYLGVLPNHISMVTGLMPGVLRYRKQGKDSFVAVSGGFLEVSHNQAIVLADTAEPGQDIDLARAKRAEERALKRIREKPAGLDLQRAELALRRSLARQKAAKG